MTIPSSAWSSLIAFGGVLPIQQNYDIRMDNAPDGRILYMGLCLRPKCPTDAPEFNLYKFEYDENNNMSWTRKPDNDTGFKYTWDDRASYFTDI